MGDGFSPDFIVHGVYVQVSCGNYHSLLLTSAGSVYAWGSNVSGQLGLQSGEVVSVNRKSLFHSRAISSV